MRDMKKRILVLFGAGAAYHWFDEDNGISAKTEDITNAIANENEFNILLNKHLKKKLKEVNFETLLNVIENLFLYYYAKSTNIENDLSALFKPESWIKDYFAKRKIDEPSDVLVSIYQSCIEKIIDIIHKYDMCIDKNSNEKTEQLKTFLKYLKTNGNVLRTYSLNYDQMLNYVSNDPDFDFYNGLEKTFIPIHGEVVGGEEFYEKFNVAQIQKNEERDCFYNLHGSIYWHWYHYFFGSEGKSQFMKSNEQFSMKDWVELNKEVAPHANPSDRVLRAPIITGFKKVQRLNFEPFNAMANAFYRDCHNADVFIFIGYSFNDPHINNVLKSADIANKKIVFVDKKQTVDEISPNLQEIIGEENTNELSYFKNKNENIYFFNRGISNFLNYNEYLIVSFLN